jgi:hypothetical protein
MNIYIYKYTHMESYAILFWIWAKVHVLSLKVTNFEKFKNKRFNFNLIF